MGLKEFVVHINQFFEHVVLHVANDADGQLCHHQRLRIAENALQEIQRQNDQSDTPQHFAVFGNEHLIENGFQLADQQRVEAGRNQHQNNRQCQHFPFRRDIRHPDAFIHQDVFFVQSGQIFIFFLEKSHGVIHEFSWCCE